MVAQAITQRQRWAYLALGMQQDVAAYQQLQTLLNTQFHAALRHDAAGMQAIAEQITAQAQLLEASAAQRFAHVQALLPQGAALSMQALFALMKSPLKEQFAGLWAQLEAQVTACKAMNLRNCQLIMQQAETMQHVIAGGWLQEDIYAPR